MVWKRKPPTEAFMGWAIDELNRIQREGIKIDGVKYGLRLLIVTSDTMARPLLRGTTQYNGEHGCDIYLHPGMTADIKKYNKRCLFLVCVMESISV